MSTSRAVATAGFRSRRGFDRAQSLFSIQQSAKRNMMSRRPKSGSKQKEVPQWKLDMLAEAGDGSKPGDVDTEPAAKRPREAAASTTSATAVEGAAAVAGARKSVVGTAQELQRRSYDDDDDDDDDIDLSSYDIGGDEADLEEQPANRDTMKKEMLQAGAPDAQVAKAGTAGPSTWIPPLLHTPRPAPECLHRSPLGSQVTRSR